MDRLVCCSRAVLSHNAGPVSQEVGSVPAGQAELDRAKQEKLRRLQVMNFRVVTHVLTHLYRRKSVGREARPAAGRDAEHSDVGSKSSSMF